jgi:hypothetical protein
MTPAAALTRPSESEHAPYYSRYTKLVPEGNIVDTLEKQIEGSLALLASIPESQAGFRYEPEKWSIKEVMGHLIDTERIMTYRALRFARNDAAPITGFEQDDYVKNANFDACKLQDLASEFQAVRRSTVYFFRGLSPDAWLRRGLANDVEVSVRALAHIVAGHELHHMEILRTQYLKPVGNQ